jgi:hypothetical protein
MLWNIKHCDEEILDSMDKWATLSLGDINTGNVRQWDAEPRMTAGDQQQFTRQTILSYNGAKNVVPS